MIHVNSCCKMFLLRNGKVSLGLGLAKNSCDGSRNMATLKTISTRLKSVKNIQKITQSMKMVSAAKYSRAEKELQQVKRLGEGTKAFFTKAEIEPQEEAEKEPDGEKKFIYIAVTSDRGLCGAVHSSIAKVIRKTLANPVENVKIVCIGDKSRALLHRGYGQSFLFVCNEVGRLPPTFADASTVVNKILSSEFGFEKISIVFNRYKSAVSYSTEQLYYYSIEKAAKSESIKIFEEDDEHEETLESFMEFSFASLLFYAMKESACSEQSSRMTAMDNASKNAGEMIGKLTLSFNRTRQAVITRELIEIISGASAL